jgi:hypothetical protein
MELVPRGLAPGGPGATGVPLLDWILSDPGLASVVFSHLVPGDVLGLRAASKAACAAVAGHAWDMNLPKLYDIHSSGTLHVPGNDLFHRSFRVTGRAALRRWRACFPAARTVVVHCYTRGYEPVTDADIATLAGVTRLGLEGTGELTDECLAPLTTLRDLSLKFSMLTGAALRRSLQATTAAGSPPFQLGSFHSSHNGRMWLQIDALPALSHATHVTLDAPNDVTDAVISTHFQHLLRFDLTICHPGFDGSGLRASPDLRALRLRCACNVGAAPDLADDCLVAPGRQHSSVSVLHLHGFGIRNGLFAHLPLLTDVEIDDAPQLTDAAFDDKTCLRILNLTKCPRFTGQHLSEQGLAGLFSLTVDDCAAFTGDGLRNLNKLTFLSVRRCPEFLAAMLPHHSHKLKELTLEDVSDLEDAALGPFTSLTRLWVARCPKFEGRALPPRLSSAVFSSCDMFVGTGIEDLMELYHLIIETCAAFYGLELKTIADNCGFLSRIIYLYIFNVGTPSEELFPLPPDDMDPEWRQEYTEINEQLMHWSATRVWDATSDELDDDSIDGSDGGGDDGGGAHSVNDNGGDGAGGDSDGAGAGRDGDGGGSDEGGVPPSPKRPRLDDSATGGDAQ